MHSQKPSLIGDGEPTNLNTSILSGEYQQISTSKLLELGIDVKTVGTGDNEYVIYVSMSNELEEKIKQATAIVSFSLIDNHNKVVLGMPNILGKNIPFLLFGNYQLRILLATKTPYQNLEAGTGYFADINPTQQTEGN